MTDNIENINDDVGFFHYQLVRHTSKEGDVFYAVHEVFYTDEDKWYGDMILGAPDPRDIIDELKQILNDMGEFGIVNSPEDLDLELEDEEEE